MEGILDLIFFAAPESLSILETLLPYESGVHDFVHYVVVALLHLVNAIRVLDHFYKVFVAGCVRKFWIDRLAQTLSVGQVADQLLIQVIRVADKLNGWNYN